MARFGRRRAEAVDGADDEEWPDDEVPARTSGRSSRTTPSSSTAPDPAPGPDDGLPSSRLRGNEVTYGYLVGAVLVLSGVIMLAVTSGKGAPTHHQPIWAALALVAGLATMLSVRVAHRLLTGFIAFAGGFLAENAKTPTSLSGVKLVAFIAPVLYFFLIFRRYTKADKANRTRQPRQSAADRRAARSKGSDKGGPTPGRPAPSGRYTPPSNKERRSRTR